MAWSICAEPPFRMIAKAALKLAGARASVRARWDIGPRPQYLVGLVTAAEEARRQGISSFSAIEFGVAGGRGLLAMQSEAKAVGAEYGVTIKVFGFDAGAGLPDLIGDYRDHPDVWRPGDYPMNQDDLRAKLDGNTQLILGNVSETVSDFFTKRHAPPLGFISIDVDLYSSTRAALAIFTAEGRRMLWHVPMYIDDIDMVYTHSKGGELLAVNEFNQASQDLFIDEWRGVKNFRPFPEKPYLNRMFLAHDLSAISNVNLSRVAEVLPMSNS
jgi:hypothetical protein